MGTVVVAVELMDDAAMGSVGVFGRGKSVDWRRK